MKYLFFCWALLICTGEVQAQFQLSGSVMSSEKTALEYATVSVYPTQDSTDIKGVITNDKGLFLFPNLPPAQYVFTVQMLGHKDWTNQFELSKDTDLGTIILEEDIASLATIEVVASQSTVESHLGKKVLRIGKDLSGTGSNALEALEVIPSVTTSPRGEIQIRGNSNVIIYINGKETKRDPATLKFVAAESLEKIEIITNPSAEHDAEGIAGIINIVYKNDKSGSLKLELVSNLVILTNPLNYGPNGGINFSWTKKKFSFFTNISRDYGKYVNLSSSYRANSVDSLKRYENLNTKNGTANTSDALIGFSIEPDSTSSLGLEINYSRWAIVNKTEQQSLFDYVNAESEDISLLNRREEVEDELWVNLSYEKTFPKDQILEISLTTGGENETNSTRNLTADEQNPLFIKEQFLRSSHETEKQRYYHGKIDYEVPVKKWGTIKTGIKLDFIRYNIFQDIELHSLVIPLPNNDFEMDMQKLGVYLIQKNKFKQFEYALGLRLEQFKSKAFQVSNQEEFNQEYIRLFPSVQLNYLIDEHDHSIGLNYTRRINRPGFFDLNPYVSYQDPLNLETGNPELEPEIANLFELNYHKGWNQFSFDLTLYNRRTNNSIQEIIEPIGGNKTLTSTVNIGSSSSGGIELLMDYNLNKLLKASATFELLKSKFKFSEDDINFNNEVSWNVRLRQELKLKNNWKIELSEVYQAPAYQIQRKRHGNYHVNFAINKKFNNKRGSLTFSVRDLFNTRQYAYSLHTSSLQVRRTYKWQTRQITLGLKYLIFDTKKKQVNSPG